MLDNRWVCSLVLLGFFSFPEVVLTQSNYGIYSGVNYSKYLGKPSSKTNVKTVFSFGYSLDASFYKKNQDFFPILSFSKFSSSGIVEYDGKIGGSKKEISLESFNISFSYNFKFFSKNIGSHSVGVSSGVGFSSIFFDRVEVSGWEYGLRPNNGPGPSRVLKRTEIEDTSTSTDLLRFGAFIPLTLHYRFPLKDHFIEMRSGVKYYPKYLDHGVPNFGYLGFTFQLGIVI